MLTDIIAGAAAETSECDMNSFEGIRKPASSRKEDKDNLPQIHKYPGWRWRWCVGEDTPEH